jgi:hypothetical protein
MKAYPPVVEFQGVKKGVVYILNLSVQNVSKSVKRIRLTPPSGSQFKVHHIPQGSIAPGLEIKVEVEFTMNEDVDQHDKVIFSSGADKLEVSLHAYIPAPKIVFDSFVNMGTVVLDNSVTAFIDITNEGHKGGSFSISYDESLPITVSPKEGFLNSKGSYVDLDNDGRMEMDEGEFVVGAAGKFKDKIRIDFTGKTLGMFRTLLNVSVNGEASRVLDVSATVVEQQLAILLPDGGGNVSSIPFGTIYFGEERVVTALLVNNGPVPASYSMLTSGYMVHPTREKSKGGGGGGGGGDDHESGAATPVLAPGAGDDDEDDDLKVKALSIVPSEGVVQPYDQVPIKFSFKPTLPPPAKGFQQAGTAGVAGASGVQASSLTFSCVAKLESVESSDPVQVHINGLAVRPSVAVDQRQVAFGECPANDRRDVLVTIKNMGDLPAEFSLNKIANFGSKPSSGLLQPLQSQTVVISFLPGQMGKFKTTMHVVVCKGLLTIPIHVSGTSTGMIKKTKSAGGTTSLGTSGSFQPTLKFVDPTDEALHAKKAKFTRKPGWETAKEQQGAYGADAEFSAGDNAQVTFSVGEQEKRANHKGTILSFLPIYISFYLSYRYISFFLTGISFYLS